MTVALVLAALFTQLPPPAVSRPPHRLSHWLTEPAARLAGGDTVSVPPRRTGPGARLLSADADGLLHLDRPGSLSRGQAMSLVTYVHSPRDAQLRFVVQADTPAVWWLNGQRLHPSVHEGSAPDTVDIQLAAGWNAVQGVIAPGGTLGAWLLGETPIETTTRPPPQAYLEALPAESFTTTPLLAQAPLRWRGAALTAGVSVRVTPWGRTAPHEALLHLVVAADTLTSDHVPLRGVAVPIVVDGTMDIGSLSRAALTLVQARLIVVAPGLVSEHPADLGAGDLLTLLGAPIQIDGWRIAEGALEARVIVPAPFAGLTLDLFAADFGKGARYHVGNRLAVWRDGLVTLCAPCREGDVLVVRILPDPRRPGAPPPPARVRDFGYADLVRNWRVLAQLGEIDTPPPNADAWLRAMLDPHKAAYRELAERDGARLAAAGSPWLHDTLYLVGYVPMTEGLPAWDEGPERVWRDALAMQQHFPGATFAAGGAAHYHDVQNRAPALFDSVRTAVRHGTWGLLGGWWGDPNLASISGEAAIRQGLHGQLEYQQLFDRRCTVAWASTKAPIPATLPQIWNGLGMRQLVIVGDQSTATAPYGPFIWRGLDGTQVFAYRTTGQPLGLDPIAHMLARQRTSGVSRALVLYGGNAATGALEDDRARGEELRRLPAFPVMRDAIPDGALEAMQHGGPPPAWQGDLPASAPDAPPARAPEVTRETASHEALLRTTEMLAAIDAAPYPTDLLSAAWRSALAAPTRGSGIKLAADTMWAAIESLQRAALRHLIGRLETRGPGLPLVVFNPSSWVRSAPVALQLDAQLRRSRHAGSARITDAARRTAPAVFDGDSLRFFAREVPALGFKVFWLERGAAVAGDVTSGPAHLENDYLAVDIDTTTGSLVRLYDKRSRRSVLAPEGAAGMPTPLAPDSATVPPTARAIRRGGDALERWIEVELPWHGGRLVQRVLLRSYEPLVTVEGAVDAAPEGLGAELDLAMVGDSGHYEVPYGVVARHLESASDIGAVGWPNARWLDISTPRSGGAAVFADGATEWSTRNQRVRLALLGMIDTVPPAPPARHRYRYALYPHGGDWRAAAIPRRALEFGSPLVATRAAPHHGAAGHAWSLLTLDADNVYVGAVKQSAVGRSLVIRLVEWQGRRTATTLRFNRAPIRVRRANLLEDPLTIVPLGPAGRVTLSIEPWEIVTLLIDEGAAY